MITPILQNCSYYWGFAGLISYFINHPLYTVPGEIDVENAYTKTKQKTTCNGNILMR